MILSTITNVATFIVISSTNPTTLVFDSPVQFVSVGKTGDYSFFRSNNRKVVILQPIRPIRKSEMVVVTDDKNFQFKIIQDDKNVQTYYQIKEGKKNNVYDVTLSNEKIKILKGNTSYLVKNLTDDQVIINDEPVKAHSEITLPLGGAIYSNDQRVL